MLAKGTYKISIHKETDLRLQRAKKLMPVTDEKISYNDIITWILDEMKIY